MTVTRAPQQVLLELVDALGKAAAASGQMLHQHQEVRFFALRSGLETLHHAVKQMATIPMTIHRPKIQ